MFFTGRNKSSLWILLFGNLNFTFELNSVLIFVIVVKGFFSFSLAIKWMKL